MESILRPAAGPNRIPASPSPRYTRWKFSPGHRIEVLRMKLGCAVVLASLCCVMPFTPAAAQTRRALLIGINTYEPAGTSPSHPPGCVYGRCELGQFDNLDGSVNDAQSIADLLTSPKFGFPANRVVLLTNPNPPHPAPGLVLLPADQTTHDGILAAMQKYLVDLPQPGDTVVFYAASHGSLRVNSKGTKLTVLVDGRYVHADSTLVPADAYKGGYDVRDREMTRIFNAALDKGIHLTIIFDNCHSGGVSRGVSPKYRERDLPFDPRDLAEAPPLLPNGDPVPAPTQRPQNPALVFSAVQQDQSSKEMPDSNPQAESHGAFTVALVEALQVLPADTPAEVVYQRVRAVIGNEDVPDEDPDLDASPERRRQPLFGGAPAGSGSILSAVLGTAGNGNVWLDVGRASGVGVGSEFTSINTDGQKVELRLTSLDGIARSVATVVSPSGAQVRTGDIFELTKWSPAQSPPLHVFHWPATLPQSDILAAAAQIQAAGIATVADPAEEPWTHFLSWDGAHWTLQHAGASSPVRLGTTLTPDVLKQIPAGAKLWVNFPPSRELAAHLLPADPNSAVQTAADLATAEYALTGTLTANGPAWAWFHKNELAAGPPSPSAALHTPGCSPTSPYPVRSDWIAMPDASAIDKGAATLNGYAALLAKVHGWLEMANSPADASHAHYYSLALTPASGETPVTGENPLHQGDLLKMGLEASGEITEKRWVYVLDIDCQGRGTVLYPRGNSNNQFPDESDVGHQFLLPGAPTLRIGKPFGVDTFILLSTAQPLSDPYMLNFEGVSRSRGAQSPLEQLLSNTSSATRGDPGHVPTNWGIGLTTIRSVPQQAQQ
jgi:Caspase domain